VTQATAKLVPIIGDAEIDHFELVTMNTVNEQEAIQVAGKAKSIGRQYQDKMINGNSSTQPNEFDGLARLVPAAQQVGVAGASFDFGILDKMMDKVKSKDGAGRLLHDERHQRSPVPAKLRALGGASVNEVVQLPGGTETIAYRKVPIFQNDWIATDATTEPALNRSDIYAGVFDDGSKKIGLSGIGASRQNGIFVTRVSARRKAATR
jgi:hypothetical protein